MFVVRLLGHEWMHCWQENRLDLQDRKKIACVGNMGMPDLGGRAK